MKYGTQRRRNADLRTAGSASGDPLPGCKEGKQRQPERPCADDDHGSGPSRPGKQFSASQQANQRKNGGVDQNLCRERKDQAQNGQSASFSGIICQKAVHAGIGHIECRIEHGGGKIIKDKHPDQFPLRRYFRRHREEQYRAHGQWQTHGKDIRAYFAEPALRPVNQESHQHVRQAVQQVRDGYHGYGCDAVDSDNIGAVVQKVEGKRLPDQATGKITCGISDFLGSPQRHSYSSDHFPGYPLPHSPVPVS